MLDGMETFGKSVGSACFLVTLMFSGRRESKKKTVPIIPANEIIHSAKRNINFTVAGLFMKEDI